MFRYFSLKKHLEMNTGEYIIQKATPTKGLPIGAVVTGEEILLHMNKDIEVHFVPEAGTYWHENTLILMTVSAPTRP